MVKSIRNPLIKTILTFTYDNKIKTASVFFLILISTLFSFSINILLSLQLINPLSETDRYKGLITVGIYLLAFLNISITLKLITKFFSKILNDLEKDLYQKIEKGILGDIERVERGKIMTYLNRDIRNYWSFISRSIQFGVKILYLGGALFFISLFDVLVTFIAIIILISQIILIFPLNRYIGIKSREAMKFEEKTNKYFEDGINSRPLFISHSDLPKYFTDQIYTWKKKEFNWISHPIYGVHMISHISEGISSIFRISLYVVVLYSFANNDIISPIILFGIFLILVFIIGITDDLRIFLYIYYLAKQSAERLDDFFRIISIEDKDLKNTKNLIFKNLEWEKEFILSFISVTFRYKEAKINILENLSFDFYSKKVYIIEGASGVGKTTIVDLICRFYTPDIGDITYKFEKDKIPISINEFRLDTWRENIAWAPQEPLIVSGSLLKNLTLYKSMNVTQMVEICENFELINLLSLLQSDTRDESIEITDINILEEIAILRNQISSANIHLYDEPLSTHTTKKQLKFIENISKFAYRLNKIIIIISHNEIIQDYYGDNIIHIKMENESLSIL